MAAATQSCIDRGHDTKPLMGGLYCWTCYDANKRALKETNR